MMGARQTEDRVGMDDLEQTIADVLDDFDRVNFGRWRLRVNDETTISPLTTAEVAASVAKRIRERNADDAQV